MTEPPGDAAATVGSETESSDLDEVVRSKPLHANDRTPSFLLNIQSRLFGLASAQSRARIALLAIGIAVALALLISGVKVISVILNELDVVAFIGLFVVNWIGNGGVLVPIPGARFIGLLMIFQQAVILPAWEVFAVGGAAMALGLLSYYIAGARVARAYRRGDVNHAHEVAADTGMLAQASDDPGTVAAPFQVGSLGSSMAAQTASASDDDSGRRRLMRRFSDSWEKAVKRAEPTIQEHGLWGMFWLCFAPTPLGTASAFLGGAMGFGFSRYLLSSFAAKYVLTGIIVLAAFIFSDQVLGLFNNT